MDCVRTLYARGQSTLPVPIVVMKRTCGFPPRSEKRAGRRRRVQIQLQPLGIEVNGNGKVSGVKMVAQKWANRMPKAVAARRLWQVRTYRSGRCGDHGVWFPSTQLEWLAKHSVELDSQGRIIAPKAATTLSRPATRKSLLAAISPWFRSGRYRHRRRSQSGRRLMNWLEV